MPKKSPAKPKASSKRRGEQAPQPQPEGASSESEPQPQPTPPAADEDRHGNAGDDRDLPGSELLDFDGLPLARVNPGELRKDCWERIRKEGRAAGLPRHVAYERANRETDRLFSQSIEDPPVSVDEPDNVQNLDVISTADDQGVSGLGTLPPGWPELPANAQLQAEIAWVNANRLRVRSGTGVDLSRALSPAPSYSALSWLETSILFPSKFADISVKATAQSDDEAEHIRREKLAIEEIRSILSEMLEAGDV